MTAAPVTALGTCPVCGAKPEAPCTTALGVDRLTPHGTRPVYAVPEGGGVPTEAADGRPHLAYYTDGVSFVWSGEPGRPIQVCPGGYGEPVTDTIATPYVPVFSLVGWFRHACDRWLEDRQ